MLYYAIAEICRLKGYKDPVQVLLNAGLDAVKARRLLRNPDPRLPLATVEAICRVLNCTPNELIRYRQDDKQPLLPGHALHQLAGPIPDISRTLKTLSVDELLELHREMEARKKAKTEEG